MVVNGHSLPSSFIEALRDNVLHRDVGCWHLKDESDSFGNHLETEFGQVFTTESKIIEQTNELISAFQVNEIYGKDSDWKEEPGYIKDVTDFASIVAFGTAGDGSPFCFDFRKSEAIPEIIWWDDCYWRKISPNFSDFLTLFELNS